MMIRISKTMYPKALGLVVLVILYCSQSYSQGWQHSYGGSNEESLKCINELSDGNLLAVGNTNSFGEGGTDIFLEKLDQNGNLIWAKTYGKAGEDLGYSVDQTSDGGFLIVGETTSEGAGFTDVYVLKTDSLGNLQWSNTYGSSGYDYGYKMLETPGGDYFILGYTGYFGSGSRDIYLLKLDNSGNVQWTKTFGDTLDDVGYDMQYAQDGNIIIAGKTMSFGSQAGDIYLLKIDTLGSILWSNAYATDKEDVANAVYPTSDGGFIIGGYTAGFSAGKKDALLMKVDSAGNQEWSYLYGGEMDDEIQSIIESSTGKYYLSGYSYSFNTGDQDAYVLKVTDNGALVWANIYGGDNDDDAYKVIETSTGKIVVAGATNSLTSTTKSAFVFEVDADGNPGCNHEVAVVAAVQMNLNQRSVTTSSLSGVSSSIASPVSNSASSSDSTLCTYAYCDTCVWPGDVNADGIANNFDILNLGIAFGATGPVRAGATSNWMPQPVTAWTDTFLNSMNYKHADSDGDGIVGSSDLDAIEKNYGKLHSKARSASVYKPSNPDLYFDIDADSIATGSSVTVDIFLGRDTLLAANVYGLSFTVVYNNLLVQKNTIEIDFSNTWIGTDSLSLNLYKDFHPLGETDAGYIRHDHNNSSSNYGGVAKLRFVMEENLAGGKTYVYQTFVLEFQDVKIISKDGTEIPVNALSDSAVVYGWPDGINENTIDPKQVNIYPNPSTGLITLELDYKIELNELHLYDLIGRELKVIVLSDDNTMQINLSSYPSGIYFLELQTNQGRVTKRVELY
ncbi:MAG: hypothetical protein COC01_04515 [Bacteroidetes bacterium]|nr:MAG: hypothetical protein COC01_04515 [Bacteroidota bacterium]